MERESLRRRFAGQPSRCRQKDRSRQPREDTRRPRATHQLRRANILRPHRRPARQEFARGCGAATPHREPRRPARAYNPGIPRCGRSSRAPLQDRSDRLRRAASGHTRCRIRCAMIHIQKGRRALWLIVLRNDRLESSGGRALPRYTARRGCLPGSGARSTGNVVSSSGGTVDVRRRIGRRLF